MKCEKCNCIIDLKPRTISDRKRLGKPIICKKCIKEEVIEKQKKRWSEMPLEKKNKIMGKVSKGRSLFFNNMDNNGYNDWKNSIKSGMQNMSQESIEERSIRISNKLKSFWDSISNEEYERQCQLRKNGWANMDPNKRSEWYQIIINLNQSEERRKHNSEKMKKYYETHPERIRELSIAALNQWNDKSDEEKREYSEMMKSWWNSLNDKDYIDLQKKISKGIENSNDKKFLSNKLENDFASILDENKITYIRQYGTVELYDTNSDWFKIYSKHSNFLGYRKNWDFYLPDYDIYIDIDGPYHTFTGDYNNPLPEVVKYLAKKEFKNYSTMQHYYDTRRLLINKRIIILGYDKEKFKSETGAKKEAYLNMHEIEATLNILKALKG